MQLRNEKNILNDGKFKKSSLLQPKKFYSSTLTFDDEIFTDTVNEKRAYQIMLNDIVTDYNSNYQKQVGQTKDNDKLNDEIVELKNRLIQMTTTISNKEDFLTTMTRKLEKTENENAALKEKKNCYEDIKKMLEDFVKDVNEKRDTTNQDEKRKDLKSRQATNKQLQKKIKQLKERLKKITTDKQKMKIFLLKTIKDNKQYETEVEAKIKNLEEEEDKLRKERDRLLKEEQFNDNKINGLKEELDRKNGELESLTVKHDKYKKSFQYFLNELEIKDKAISATEAENKNINLQMTENIKRTHEENNKLRRDTEEMTTIKNQLRQENDELQKQIEQLTNKTNKLPTSFDEIIRTNAKLIEYKRKTSRNKIISNELKDVNEAFQMVLVQYCNSIYELRVLPSTSIYKLKEEVKQKIDGLHLNLIIVYDWKILVDCQTLADCGIKDDDAVLCLKQE